MSSITSFVLHLYSNNVLTQLSRDIFNVSPLKIKSLVQLLEQKKSVNVIKKLQDPNQPVFLYGMDPLQFRLHCMVYFKYGYWHSNTLLQSKLLSFISKCDQQEKKYKKITQADPNFDCKAQMNMITNYRKVISTLLMPSSISQFQFTNVYLNQLSSFLTAVPSLTEKDMTFITFNFERILFRADTLKPFFNEKDNAWLITHAFSLFLDHCIPVMSSLPVTLKSALISVARSLRVKHMPFLEWLKSDIQKQKKEVSLHVFLNALIYLGHHNSFPYQYFYRNKDSLMGFIEAAENLSEKKAAVSTYMLQIFARQRLACCERIINRLLICIKENLAACDVSQLSRIFYFYSKLKCSIDHDFVVSLIQRLYLFMNILESADYVLIIKAVASLNYHDDQLLKNLKEYNYELFLSSLKFGCSSLGSYYKAVLDEVEASFVNDENRYYRQEDAPFKEVEIVQQQAPV